MADIMRETGCTRRGFLRSVGLGATAAALPGLACAAGAERRSRRPNVLFLMTDQQTLRAMSAYGNPHLKTPHMDSLAAGGVRFGKSYCTAPVCGPSRSSLITSRMPHVTGVNINGQTPDPSIPNMGQVFRGAGYATAWAGKWHLPRSYPQGPVPGFEYLRVPDGTKFGLGAQTDGPVADEAIAFLRRRHERPFLLGVSLHNPHDICWSVREDPPDPIDERLLPPLPANFEIDPNEPEFIGVCRRRTKYGPEILYTKDWDETRWRAYLYQYYRHVEEVDVEIGRILHTLRQQGLEDDTLIVFTSDHGEGAAAHHWVVKLMLYEEPATVPLVVSWKGVTPAGRVDRTHLVSGLDVLPTLCDYAGIGLRDDFEGMSLRPLIEHPERPGREFVVTELASDSQDLTKTGRMIRTQRYKYIAFSFGARPEMLFDMVADPGEMDNLALRDAARSELDRHRALLRRWISETGDDFQVPS
ncbi:MAG: sulfatase-like hydrolase/transferase [Sedimentisphaerales bacterium]|nr:sulfatase-like hydrolase/transferase [Sedimentisphaerales bacterium]